MIKNLTSVFPTHINSTQHTRQRKMGAEKRKYDDQNVKHIPAITGFCPRGQGSVTKVMETFSMTESMAKATLEVAKDLGPDDPGFSIMFASEDAVHAAMGRNNAPGTGQGGTPAASVAAMRHWIIQNIPDAANQQVDMPANAHNQGICIKNLSVVEAAEFRIAINDVGWAYHCHADGDSAGSLMEVTGEGAGRCTMIRVPHSGFQ